METSAIICVQCQRVLALGASLPAVCPGFPSPGTDGASRPPAPEHDCIELEVTVPEGLGAMEALTAVERIYAGEIAALGALAPHLSPQP